MPSYQRNILVGLTVMISLVAFGWMALQFSSKTADLFAPPQIPVHFKTPRADGISPGSAVEYLGVEVGRVISMNRNADGMGVTVDAVVAKDPPLPANVRAVVISTNALGGTSIISMDHDNVPPHGALTANETINAEYRGLQLNLIPPSLTDTASDLGAMSNEIRLTAKKLRESGAIDDLDKTLKTFSAQATKIGALADSLQAVFGDSSTQTDLKTAIANLRSTTDKLDKMADRLQTASVDASVTIKGAGKDIDQLSKQIGDRLTEMSGVLTSLQSILGKVDKGQGTAGQLVNDPRLYQSLVDTSRELNATVADLKRLVEQWEEEGVDLHLK